MVIVLFFFTKHMANDDFSEPPRRADPQNSIFIFYRILGAGHLRVEGSVAVRIRGGGGHQWSPLRGGGVLARVLYPHPPAAGDGNSPTHPSLWHGASYFCRDFSP